MLASSAWGDSGQRGARAGQRSWPARGCSTSGPAPPSPAAVRRWLDAGLATGRPPSRPDLTPLRTGAASPLRSSHRTTALTTLRADGRTSSTSYQALSRPCNWRPGPPVAIGSTRRATGRHVFDCEVIPMGRSVNNDDTPGWECGHAPEPPSSAALAPSRPCGDEQRGVHADQPTAQRAGASKQRQTWLADGRRCRRPMRSLPCCGGRAGSAGQRPRAGSMRASRPPPCGGSSCPRRRALRRAGLQQPRSGDVALVVANGNHERPAGPPPAGVNAVRSEHEVPAPPPVSTADELADLRQRDAISAEDYDWAKSMLLQPADPSSVAGSGARQPSPSV